MVVQLQILSELRELLPEHTKEEREQLRPVIVMGAGGGMVETIASLSALGGELFPIKNLRDLDPRCPINACRSAGTAAGDQFINVNITPQGQASAIRIRRFSS